MTRRHRILESELKPTKKAIEKHLLDLANEADPSELFNSEMLFRLWFRLETHRQGCPRYPLFMGYGTIIEHLQPLMVPFNPNVEVKP